MQAHATIPLTPSTLEQVGGDPVVGVTQCTHSSAPHQCTCRQSAPNTSHDNDAELQLDKVFLLLARMNAGPLNSQRAAVPELVAKGVIPMGWRVPRSDLQNPADLQFFDRLEHANARRMVNQCSSTPLSLRPKVASPMVFYLESIRQKEAMESPIIGSGSSQATPTSGKCAQSLSNKALINVESSFGPKSPRRPESSVSPQRQAKTLKSPKRRL